MPEDMAYKLIMLIILPAIMTACATFSVVSSIIVILIIVLRNLKRKNVEEEKKADSNITKDDQYQFSIFPDKEKDMIMNENHTNTETENGRQKCINVEFST